MRVEWTQAQTDGKPVILVAKLLEHVDAALPQSGELDLDSKSFDESVAFRVRGSCDIQPLRCTPSCDESFTDGTTLP
jgi:hypothetical protein